MSEPVYEFQPGVILGFHGCDADLGEHILSGQGHQRQLAREIFELSDEEKAQTQVSRFKGITIEAARMRGITARGWLLGGLCLLVASQGK